MRLKLVVVSLVVAATLSVWSLPASATDPSKVAVKQTGLKGLLEKSVHRVSTFQKRKDAAVKRERDAILPKTKKLSSFLLAIMKEGETELSRSYLTKLSDL